MDSRRTPPTLRRCCHSGRYPWRPEKGRACLIETEAAREEMIKKNVWERRHAICCRENGKNGKKFKSSTAEVGKRRFRGDAESSLSRLALLYGVCDNSGSLLKSNACIAMVRKFKIVLQYKCTRPLPLSFVAVLVVWQISFNA